MIRLRNLTATHWAWLHAKFALAVWTALLVTHTPTSVQSAIGDLLVWAIAVITMFGAVIAAVGLVLSAPPSSPRVPTPGTIRGLGIEMFGLLWMLIGGLIAYTGVQGALALAGDDQRIALTALMYAFSATILARLVTVRRQRTRQRAYVHPPQGES